MENMTELEYAWMIYLIGAVGCCLATWLLFRRAGRAWVHFFVITVAVILFTPFSLKLPEQPMLMAPAVFAIAFGFLEHGLDHVREMIKLLLGLWAFFMVLSLLYQLLTRKGYQARLEAKRQAQASAPAADFVPPQVRYTSTALSREEREAEEELLGEPIRAQR